MAGSIGEEAGGTRWSCGTYEPWPGSRRCKHYMSDGACSLPTEFMCSAWLARQSIPVPAVQNRTIPVCQEVSAPLPISPEPQQGVGTRTTSLSVVCRDIDADSLQEDAVPRHMPSWGTRRSGRQMPSPLAGRFQPERKADPPRNMVFPFLNSPSVGERPSGRIGRLERLLSRPKRGKSE
jgi:hypothetical protein